MLKVLSSLEKVFPCEAPTASEFTTASCLQGELFHFQIAVFHPGPEKLVAPVHFSGIPETAVQLYAVKFVPATLPAYPDHKDEHYLTTSPGLFPDLLRPLGKELAVPGGQWRCIWVEINTATLTGVLTLHLTVGHESCNFALTVLSVPLPKQQLINTHWFHCDCLATQYGVAVFSEAHWTLIDRYVANAARYGMNMLLTPVFTPPLDTVVGGERPTVQLVEVEKKGDTYHFGFAKLDRYVALAQSHGVTYFEIAHPFTQWGAGFCPKILITENGSLHKRFGWTCPATSPEYEAFLAAFLPALKTHLRALGIFAQTYFHVSDEPSEEHLESYRAAVALVAPYYADCNVIDALSEYRFYAEGSVKTPVVAVDAVEPFLANAVPNLWVYYCCAQNVAVSNRFLAMPSARNRILAYQLFRFDIVGFLHWGHNFWYAQNSRYAIDPFSVTDADEAFPAGDPFLVYPGEDGYPLSSIRQMVFHEALQDLSALQLLAQKMPKDEIFALLHTLDATDILFHQYPRDPAFLLAARASINEKIATLFAT